MPPIESLERLADSFAALERPVERKRMLVIVNPYATTVSDRLKNLVVYALQGRYEVDAMDTEGRDHATVLCREAAEEGYDVVVAFGGDGTVNEAANGLAHSPTPLTPAARRRDQRLLQDARRPERHRRRHRAPAAPRRRLDAAPGRPRPRQRPRLHLLGGLRARRLRRAPRRRPSGAEGAPEAVVLRLRGGRDVQPGSTSCARRAWRRTSAARSCAASPRPCRTATPTPTSAVARSISPKGLALDDGQLRRRDARARGAASTSRP